MWGETGGEGRLCRGESSSLRTDVSGRTSPFLPFGIGFCESTCKALSSEGCAYREAALTSQGTAWRGEILPCKILACVPLIATKPEFHLCCFWRRMSNSRELGFFQPVPQTSLRHRECRWSEAGEKVTRKRLCKKIWSSLEISSVHNPETCSTVVLKVPYRCRASHCLEYIPYSNTYVLLYLFTLWTLSC